MVALCLIRNDSHKYGLKARVFADVGQEMFNVGVPFIQELTVCLRKVDHCQRFSFRDRYLFSKYLRESVDIGKAVRSSVYEWIP